MPVFSVSEPYINLWIEDEPLGYQPATGPRISLKLGLKQREQTSGTNPAVFSVGKLWNFSWLSFVAPDVGTNNVVNFAGGGSSTYSGTTDYLTDTRLIGDRTNGFTLSYPDGSKDVYGLVVNNGSGVFLKAFMTERWNAINQKTRLDYDSYTPGSSPVIRLRFVVDGDGRTNTVSYVSSNAFSTNLISQVVDAFGRTNLLAYDNQGRLTNITDVAGMSSGLAYDSMNWPTNLVTPYGTNAFKFTEVATNVPYGRALEITEPNGSKQLYLFRNSAPGIPATNQVPDTTPFTNTFENSSLDVRNTFHWGRLQYANLSTNYLNTGNLANLTTNDFLKARWNHWLEEPDATVTNVVSETLSLKREPSPDGTTAGQLTWYDYAGKTNVNYIGTQSTPLFVARVLPGGTNSWYTRTDRNALGHVTTNISTYSVGSSNSWRTNIFTYATNDTDLVKVIRKNDLVDEVVSSNYFNAYHLVLTNYNALSEATTFTYNTNQQLVSVQWPSGLTTTNIYFTSGTYTNWLDKTIDLEISRTNSFTYTNGLVYTHTDERGLVTTNSWDALRRLTSVADSRGTITLTYDKLDLVKVVDRLGHTNGFGFNAVRQLVAQTNALGNVTRYGYCDCGALEYVTNALNQVTHFVYDYQGNLTGVFLPDGSAITNQFDSLGRLTKVVAGFGSFTNWYNNQGLVVVNSNYFGQALKVSFDILDRATNVVDANGVTLNHTYDVLDRLTTRSVAGGGTETFNYTARGLTNYIDQLGKTSWFVLDAARRKTTETNANNEVLQFKYDVSGLLTNLIDGKSQNTWWGYDIYGRNTTKTNATPQEILRFQYDADNRPTNRWSAAKGNTGYLYDKLSNLTNINYPVSPDITLQYDAVNRLTNMVDAVGTTAFGYSATGQLLSEDGPWTSDTVSYAYANGLRSGLNLLQPNASSWAQTYGYDAANRLQTLTSPAGVFTYTYNGQGNLVTNLALPNAAAITNAFDALGRLTGTYLKNSGGTILNSHAYQYNNANQRTKQTLKDGNYVDYTYDNIGQLTTALGKESGGTSRLQEQLKYSYDTAGNLSNRTNNALVQTFTANNRNELTAVTRSGTLTVAGTTSATATNVTVNSLTATRYTDATFVKDGFTLADGNNTFTAVAQDNLGRSDTHAVTFVLPASPSFTYDTNGNLMADGRRTFLYDDENQLISIVATNTGGSSTLTTNIYDGKFRRRVRKEFAWVNGVWSPTAEMRYLYDGDVVLQERDGNNVPSASYTRGRDLSGGLSGAGGIGGLLARSDLSMSIPTHAYYQADGNGNVAVLVNAQQVIVAKYLYDPFGNILSKSGPLADANTYRFSSQEYHQPSGLVLYLYRAYDPNLQRWPNRDPIEELGGINLYGYVGNNPVNFIDPLGLHESPTIMRWVVPGQVSWDNAVTAWQNAQYGNSAAWGGMMVADQALFIASLGT